ncbi:outer membrane lipoprotein-sorting protein [Cellvibrio sp. KY-GH-1]|nr:outer membrane lipoprotein-sorting protein [Cellvibrio sp. KY-GH-1]
MEMKKLFKGGMLGFMCFFAVQQAATAEQMSGNDIVATSEDRYIGKTQKSDSTMIMINSDGKERVRRMSMIRKNFGENLKDQKAIYFFNYPEDIKDTSYLSFDWIEEGKDDDSWLYLPALKKVKRLAAADQSDPFLGSDFTYADIKTSRNNYWDYSIIKTSEVIDGHDCWVLEGLPKNGDDDKVIKETGYNKIHLWVRKDNFIKVKGTFWVVKGKRVKYFEAKEVEKINDIWTAKVNKITTTKGGATEHSTVIKIENVRYEEDVDDANFTPLKMSRGIAK